MSEVRSHGKDIAEEPVEQSSRSRQSTPIGDLEKEFSKLSGDDENVAELLANNWQRVLGALVLTLLGVWLYNEYQTASLTRKYSASEYFTGVQSAYEELLALNAKPPTAEETGESVRDAFLEKERLLTENAKLLRSTSKDSVYPELADLYEAKFLLSAEKRNEALKLLEPYLATAVSPKDRSSQAAIAADLAGLLKARSDIDIKALDDARSELLKIIKRGGIGSVEAVIALASISSTPEQRAELRSVAEATIATFPELAEAMKQEMNKAGL